MARAPTGAAYKKGGGWYARVRLRGVRVAMPLPTCTTEEEARERAALLASLAEQLGRAGNVREEVARNALRMAATREGKALEGVRQAVEQICRGEATPKGSSPAGLTVQDLGRRWTSGELAREHPDHVKTKRSAGHDAYRLERYVYPIVGNVPLPAFTLDHAEAVMRAIPAGKSSATRRHVGQLLHRLLAMAVFPLRLREASPLPRGFLPKVGPEKGKAYLYPDEDARLLAHRPIPLCWRVLYGVLHREGMRVSEAARLGWRDLDLVRGDLTLDENKTDDPRAWALGDDVVRALRAWRAIRAREGAAVEGEAPVFVGEDGEALGASERYAPRYREHLQAAGVDRALLFQASATRLPIRLHDSRATFITLSLANGRTEAWVQDRTGHKSSIMINRYRRAARHAAELRLGPLAPLDRAIPELAAERGTEGGGEASGGGKRGSSGGRSREGARQAQPPEGTSQPPTAGPEALEEAPADPGEGEGQGSAESPPESPPAAPADVPAEPRGNDHQGLPIGRPVLRTGAIRRLYDAKTGRSAQIDTGCRAQSAFKIHGPKGRPGSSPGGATTAESLGNLGEGEPAEAGSDAGCCPNRCPNAGGGVIHPRAGGLTCAGRAGVGQETGQGEFSRVAMVEQLAAEISRATAAGDLEAARVAHEMIGRLLALLASGGGGGAAVVDLATERDRRGR